jgi:dolichyl-diphosphooligosaccharide---protein glycosyltransferase
LVDKPGRRKRTGPPWGKVAAAAVVALIAVAAGYYIYENYIYQPPPVYAELGTSQGYIYVELYPSCAPATVANFVNLTNTGFYNHLVWHRIVPGFVIQTGDPNTKGAANGTRSSWGKGQSSQSVPFEWCGWLHNYAGYLAMASTAPKGPSTSQFFINLSNSTSNLRLDDNYTVFGKVILGMNVVCDLANKNLDPTYPASDTTVFSQPINLASALLNNVTIIPSSMAPPPQPIRQQC